MKFVRDKLIAALEPFGFNILQEGTYSINEELPDSFISYEIIGSDILRSYDNKPTRIGYDVDITLHSNDMSVINSTALQLFDALIDAGFTAPDAGYDAGMNTYTGHYAWDMEFYLIEERSINNGN